MEYDGLNRLKRVYAPAIWGDALYSYDALDNLTSSQLTGGLGIARTMLHNYDSVNRLASVTGTTNFSVNYGYDSQGNITQRGSQAYVFDMGNRMRQASGLATYGYDGFGRRTSVIGTDGVTRLQMYSSDGKLVFAGPTTLGKTKYIYLHNHVIAEVSSAGTKYMHTDGLGSPVASTNAGGLVSRTRYEPYGKTAAGAEPTVGFTGHYNDIETGLTYMQQRYYDPVAGRFLSIDPVTTDANTGGSFNRYAYANNSPYRYIDPDGRQAMAACAAGPLGCIAGALITGAIIIQGAKAARETTVLIQSRAEPKKADKKMLPNRMQTRRLCRALPAAKSPIPGQEYGTSLEILAMPIEILITRIRRMWKAKETVFE